MKVHNVLIMGVRIYSFTAFNSMVDLGKRSKEGVFFENQCDPGSAHDERGYVGFYHITARGKHNLGCL